MGIWTQAVDALQSGIAATGEAVGSPLGGVALLTFAVRAALVPVTLPLAVRSKHHAAVMRRIKPQVKALTAEHKDDFAQQSAALKALYRENGISMVDGAGLVAALLQLPVMIAFFQAVLHLAKGTDMDPGALWLRLVLGAVAAGASAQGVRWSGQGDGAPWMLWMSLVLPVAITVWLGTAVGAYLAAFYAAMLVQALLMRRRAAA